MNMREELKAFVDNEVSDADRVRILKEIESNPDLQAEVIELRQMSRMISEEAWQPEPVGLERTLGALKNPTARKPWWMSNGLVLAGAAVCTVIFAAIVFPVFAQSKMAAKRTSDFAAMKSAASPSMSTEDEAKSDMEGALMQDKPASSAAEAQISTGARYRYQSGGKNQTDVGGFSGRAGEQERNSRSPKRDLSVASPQNAPAENQPQARYEIKTANLSVEVDEVPKAQQTAESIAKAVGGRVESSQKSNDEGTLASAELTFRVPVASFETAVNRIRKLGRVLNDSLNGNDVTGEVADAEARLKVMRAEEDQYVELLKATKKIGEVLSVKERLSQVRQEIESLDATRKTLRGQAAESTINLSLSEKPKPDRPKQNESWLDDVWANSVAGLNSVGRGIGTAGVFLFVFSPIWLPLALLGWYVNRRVRRY